MEGVVLEEEEKIESAMCCIIETTGGQQIIAKGMLKMLLASNTCSCEQPAIQDSLIRPTASETFSETCKVQRAHFVSSP